MIAVLALFTAGVFLALAVLVMAYVGRGRRK